MSETPRVYSSGGSGFRLNRRGSRRIGRVVFGAAAVLFVYALWTTRDSHPVYEFIESGRQLEIVIPRANLSRHRFVESRMWDGIPTSWVAGWPEAMADTHGLPEWAVGNLVGSGAIAVADDLDGWTDLVVVSQMTRAGALIERLLRFAPSTSGEWAGGLRIRHWERGKVHYAARGRTLLVSPSRDALVTALTLSADRRVAREAVRNALTGTGVEDARGTFTLGEDDALGRVFSKVRFAVRIENAEAVLKLRATIRTRLAEDLQPYWGGTTPVSLPPAFEGPIAVSADFGTNIEDTWRVLSELFEWDPLSAEQWEAWRLEDGGQSPAAVLTALLGPMGPAMRVTWTGTDMQEMAPTPILVGSVSGSRERAESILDGLPGPAGAQTAAARVYFDGSSETLEAPTMSGPSMAPRGRWIGDALFFSTSAAVADRFLADGLTRTIPAPRAGNLFVQIDPGETMQILVNAGRDLAQGGLLRGYTVQTFRDRSRIWLDRAAAIESVHALATVNHEAIELEVFVKGAAPAPVD